MTVWRNWSGLETATPTRVEEPADVAAVVAAVERARAEASTVKMAGTGHSFTAIAAPEGTLLTPRRLTGIVAVDRDAMTVTALAGTPLKVLNAGLEALGLSLHNMGDIAEQTLAGAISTGTHGTGGVAAGLAAQVDGLELVTGTGEVLRATRDENADVLEMARVGLGALGILTTVTFRVEPLFLLEAHEQPMSWDEALGSFDEMVAGSHHVDLYWFPHTDRMLTKRNDRLDADPAEAEPLPRWRAWLDDDFLANTVFGARHRRRQPRARGDPADEPADRPRAVGAQLQRRGAPGLHRPAGRGLPGDGVRRPARGRPGGAPRGPACGGGVGLADQLPGGDPGLAPPTTSRCPPRAAATSFYLAFHTHRDADHTAYFAGVEADHAGPRRPPALGQGAHPDGGRPGAGVPPLRRLPRDARPARSRPGVRERAPAPGPGRLAFAA